MAQGLVGMVVEVGEMGVSCPWQRAGVAEGPFLGAGVASPWPRNNLEVGAFLWEALDPGEGSLLESLVLCPGMLCHIVLC